MVGRYDMHRFGTCICRLVFCACVNNNMYLDSLKLKKYKKNEPFAKLVHLLDRQ